MSYSIHFDLQPSALKVIDESPNDHVLAFLKECFKYDHQRLPDNNGHIFSWIRPHKRNNSEAKLFDALRFLLQEKLLVSIVADDWNSEPSIIEKLKKYRHTELIPVSSDK